MNTMIHRQSSKASAIDAIFIPYRQSSAAVLKIITRLDVMKLCTKLPSREVASFTPIYCNQEENLSLTSSSNNLCLQVGGLFSLCGERSLLNIAGCLLFCSYFEILSTSYWLHAFTMVISKCGIPHPEVSVFRNWRLCEAKYKFDLITLSKRKVGT